MKLYLSVILAAWNLAVFAVYALDKWKAIHQRWRVPEKVLLTMSYLGGGIAALLAGKLVHHKTRKWYFWFAWILGSLLEIGVIYLIWVYL